jgi:23S rRNA (guanosine2251-2'-O)-methyltransferase
MNPVIYGIHAVQTALKKYPERVLEIWTIQERNNSRLQEIINLARQFSIKVHISNRDELDRLAEGVHQGVVARIKTKEYNENDLLDLLEELSEPPLLLILDGVQDPHNLGACLRTANAAGVHAVIAPKDKAVSLTPTVRKVACGAAELTPFISVTNLARTIAQLKDRGIWIYGTAEDANEVLYKTSLKGAIAWVMGAEGQGLRRLTMDLCDVLVKIPMQGEIPSLNVSVATSVCLFETLRQRYF